jgi:AraC-like DNA-binding protein
MPNAHKHPSVSIHYLNIINNALERIGFQSPEIKKLTGQYSEQEYYFNRVPLATLEEAWQNAEQITQDPIIGLHVGEKIHPGDYGLLGQIMMNCNDLAEALEKILSVEFIINNIFVSEVIIKDDCAVNRIHSQQYEAESIRHIIEQDISALINIGLFVMNKEYTEQNRPIEIHFRHKPAADIAEYERLLKTKVLFEQEHNQAIFPLAILEAPIYNPNPRIAELLNVELQQLLHEVENKDTLTLRLWRHFQTREFNFTDDIESIAQQFNITARTLQRRLQQEGTSFQDEIKYFRTQQAKQLLSNKQLTICEIAYQMGFNDNSAFHKAFKRWTDMTPKEYQVSCKQLN